jgi:integrase
VRRSAAEERAAACGADLDAGAFVFSDSPDGAFPWRPGRVTLAFGRLCRLKGITGVRLHDLRHFAASRLLGAGVPMKTVAGRLGHANAATTLGVYAHFLESSDAEADRVLSALLEGHRLTEAEIASNGSSSIPHREIQASRKLKM